MLSNELKATCVRKREEVTVSSINSMLMQQTNWLCDENAPFCIDQSIILTMIMFTVMTVVVGLIAFMKIRNYRLRKSER